MSRKPKILLIDDHEDFHKNLRWALEEHFNFVSVLTAMDAIASFDDHNQVFDLILIDLKLSQTDKKLQGFSLMDYLYRNKTNTPYIVITNSKQINHVVESIKRYGAIDYLPKDEYDPNAWGIKFKNAINQKKNNLIQKELPKEDEAANNSANDSKNVVQGNSIGDGANLHVGDINIIINGLKEIPEKITDPEKIRTLIANEKIQSAIDKLLSNSENGRDVRNEVVRLSNRWRKLQKEVDETLITSEAAKVEHNKIVKTLLEILNTIEDNTK